MKRMLAAAFACMLIEVAYWLPRGPQLEPKVGCLQSIPSGAQCRWQGGEGRTPMQFKSAVRGSVTLTLLGYQSESTEVGDIRRALEPVRLRLSPLGWLVHHFFGWLALVCAGLAYYRRQRDQPEPPRRVGPYLLHEKVGQGATAEVFRATSPAGQEVALKWLFEQAGGTQEFAARFRREAEICSQLKHPGIVGVHAWGEHEGRLWMAQDWVAGDTLAMRPLPMDPELVRQLFVQLFTALDYAHQSGVVHRDLKPSNILLRLDGSPVIGDFGLARSTQYATITKTDTTLGTPTYMPPEQIMGERGDPRSDLYSLGCVAFELLTGKLPHLGSDAIKTLLAHLHDPVPPMPGQSQEWQELVSRLLAKEVDQRPASAREVLNSLQSLSPIP